MKQPAITLITGNPHKLRDISDRIGLELLRRDINLPEIQSTDVVEVATEKAKEAYARLGVPILIDDASLTFNHWKTLPGALIKFFMTNVGANGLLDMLKGAEDRRCVMDCVLVYYDQEGPQIFHGRTNGFVSEEVRGDHGWGYDTIVIPEGEEQTCAELTGEKYWHYSSRQRAIDAFNVSAIRRRYDTQQ